MSRVNVLLVFVYYVQQTLGLLITSVPVSAILKQSVMAGESELTLLFSASRDGWDSSAFHEKCDFNPPLPSLVLARERGRRAIIGAVNPLGWQSRDDYRDSSRTYLFRAEGSTVQFSTKLPGGPAVYDFGDRGVWLAEALEIPLNPKFMGRKKARSSLSSSFSSLSPPIKGVTGLFSGQAEVELSDLEVYSSQSFILQSKPMTSTSGGSSPSVFQKLESFLFGKS